MRKRLLQRIVYLCLHHPRKVLLVFFIIFGLAFFLTGRLRFDPDFLKLFPAEKGPIRLYMENLKETGAFDLLFILLESKEGVDSKGLIESGQTIADKLKEMEVDGEKAFRSIRFQKVEPEDFEKAKPGFTLFLTHPYLFLNEGDIEKLKKKWTEEEIAKQIQKNKKLLVSHASFLMKDLIQTDPFELRWLFMEKWKEGMKGMEFDESSNFFLSKDQKFLLLITEPSRPATDFRFSKSLMIELEKLKSTEQENPIKVYLTGAHPIATAEAKVLRFDMQSSFLISLGLVLFLFFYVYRRWITLLIIGLPLLGGIQLTMGIASFILGSLNILTIAFAAILVGLGIDFAIHLYDRYHQERAWGKDLSSAIEITLTETGSGIWTGAFTTIFAFIILFFSRVRGITELAFLVSTGLFCSLLCIYFVLPSFLVWMDQRKKSYPYSDLKPLSFKRTSTFIERYPLPIFLGLIGVTLLFGLFSIGIEIEKDFRNLRPKEIESMEAFDRMAKAFGGRKWEGISVHEGREIQALLSKEEEWVRVLEKYQRDGKIDSFYSLSKLIPSLEKQKKVANLIRESIDLDRVKKSFIKALEENGFEVVGFQSVIPGMDELRRGDERIYPPETLLAFLQQGPFKKGIEPLFAKKDDHFRLISHIYYKRGGLSLEKLEKELPKILITGPERVELEILRIVREDLYFLTPLAFLMVLLIVTLHFRNGRVTLFVLSPLIMGLIWMIGMMSVFGIKINFVNAVILPMIIGMGIDNSIHLMHRYLEEKNKGPGHALRTTGRAMVMCSLTTILGFGSLATARYQAVSTMGWVTIFGMGFCLMTALFFLPTLLILWKGRQGEI